MKYSNKKDRTVLRLIYEAKPIAHYLLLAALLDVFAVLCAVATPELLGQLVQMLYDDLHLTGALHTSLVQPILVLLGVYTGSALLGWLNMQMMNRVVSRHYSCKIRIKISDKLRRLPVKYVDQTPVGDILNRMTGDVSEIGGYMHQIFDLFVKGFFQMVMIAVAMFMENWMLACLVVLATPFSIWLSAKLASRSEKYYDEMFARSGELTELVEEAFSNFPTTKAYNLEQQLNEKHAKINASVVKATEKAYFTGSLVQPLIKFTNALAYILISLLGTVLILKQGLGVGVVVTVVLYARQFATPLEQISMGLADLQHIKAAAKRVFALLDMEEESVAEGTVADCRGGVEFDHVAFSYTPDAPLIQDLHLGVEPGQTVAIVGPTGAGKTTIVNLLMRFYDVDAGCIRLDGHDIATLSREEVRRQYAMVLQDTWLFRGTIAENVAYGKPGATRQEIEEACQKAYCDHFIRTMPEGYDTVIGEDTSNISGGQRQLLTIARAILADRPLLILDEATSNVDTRTEGLIQNAMDTLMKGRTSFIIAHRLSTIVNADRILVMDHGRIVEQGDHRTLLQKKGLYYRLYTSQYAG